MVKVSIEPQAGGQVEFLSAAEYEVLYGGSAGPGKTWSLVVDALGFCWEGTEIGRPAYRLPGYTAVLFRRTTKQFQQLLKEAKAYYKPLGGRFTLGRTGDPGPCFEWGPEHTGGAAARIYICHMEHEDNKEDHQGQEYQYVGFDEICQFTLTQYTFLLHRARGEKKVHPLLKVKVRGTANPVGVGLWWVKKRFPVFAPMQTKWYLAVDDPEINPAGIEVPRGTPEAVSRRFVPGYLQENKYLDYTEEAAKIRQMGSKMAAALLDGDWNAFAGDFFPEFDQGREVIDPFPIPTSWRLVGSLDPGYSSFCSFGLQAMDPKGNLYRILTYYERMRNPEQNAVGIYGAIRSCKWTQGRMPELIVSGRDAWAKRDRLAVIQSMETFADVFEKHGLLLTPATTERKNGWWTWRQLMPYRYFIFRNANNALINEMISAVADEKDPEDIQGRGNDPEVQDHALDEQRYGVLAIDPPRKVHDEPGDTWQEKIFRPVMKEHEQPSGPWKPGMD